MADEKTRGDALRQYMTGAASAGGTQADASESLGEYRSSTENPVMGVQIASAIPYTIIEYVAGKNGTGDGTLTATGDNELTWTPPGGSVGSAVTIADGETKIIAGSDYNKWLRVKRTSASALSGTATLTLTKRMNNVIGFDNVASLVAAAGAQHIRALCAMNVGTAPIDNTTLWLAELGTAATTDAAQLGASGAGTVGTTGSFADWPDQGFARLEESDGTLREIVYYSSRTDTVLTVPAEGRELLETTAAAGAANDEAHAVPGLEIALEYADVGTAAHTGTGLDDATIAGDYKGKDDITVRVEIDSTGTPDTFKYSVDGGTTWEDSGVAITGSAQDLKYGVTVNFGDTTGHTQGDYWDSVCTATATEPTDESDTAAVAALTWVKPIAQTTALEIGTLEAGEQVFVWLKRTIIEGHQSDPSVVQTIEWGFDSA